MNAIKNIYKFVTPRSDADEAITGGGGETTETVSGKKSDCAVEKTLPPPPRLHAYNRRWVHWPGGISTNFPEDTLARSIQSGNGTETMKIQRIHDTSVSFRRYFISI